MFLVLRVQRELKQPERAARNNIHVSAQVACPAERSVWDQTTALLEQKEAPCYLGFGQTKATRRNLPSFIS